MKAALTEGSERRDKSVSKTERGRPLPAILLPGLVVTAALLAGVVECVYGRTVQGGLYGSDAVQYLDMSRALDAGNWKQAMNPYWGFGYPMLLAVIRPLFPSGPVNDLFVARFLNLAIFAASGLSFCYLVKGLLLEAGSQERSWGGKGRWVLLFGGASIFAGTQLCIDCVSRFGPDQLVACLFFLTCGLVVRMVRKGAVSLSILCGLVMGFGYVTKQAFLPLGCFVLIELCLVLRRRTLPLRHVAVCAIVFAAIASLYAFGLTVAFGRPTLAEAGVLNYAVNVNRLEKWAHWEGGTLPAEKAIPQAAIARFVDWTNHPPDFGKPIHPSQIVSANPTIFAFGIPFSVTYPPFYNPPWWYEGYRHFWNWRYQVVAIGYNSLELAKVLLTHPLLYAAAIAVVLLAMSRKNAWSGWTAQQWPVWLLALAMIALYLPVHLEGRYIAPALAVLAITTLVGIMGQGAEISSRGRIAVLTIFLIGAVLEGAISEWVVLRRIARGDSYAENLEWKAAELMTRAGLKPGTNIGTISWEPSLHCDWAYIARLDITGEIATANDWKQFWSLTAETQQQVIERFRLTGATAVVAWYRPDSSTAPGWERMGNLPVWVYRL